MSTSSYGSVISGLLIALLIVLAWAVNYGAGGTVSVAPHLFYVPVVLAAVRYGRPGAVIAGVAAGIMCGPVLPLDVDEGTRQETLSWMLRGCAFVVVGLIVAFFVHHARSSIGDEFARLAVRRDLRRAIDAGHLHAELQPIVELATGRTVGAEALVRWNDPDRGSISPADFVPAAEEAGAAGMISEFMLGEVTRLLSEWRENGIISRDVPFKIAVNISADELHDDRLELVVRDLVIRQLVPPEWLHIELTETAIVNDLERAIRGLQRLRGIGVRISVDDFGAGETSLRYLHRFPIDTIKIDRSFITTLVDDEHGKLIVQSVIDLAHHMGMRVVAEGVETDEHAQLLASMGCDLAQGYHFARPLMPSVFEAHLRDQTAGTEPAWLPHSTER
jgi:EAL domain-containing protein (putative c-di-GMP-specific phosphodiesterase class I)